MTKVFVYISDPPPSPSLTAEYPNIPPAVACSCPGVDLPLLREHLDAEAMDCLGTPMIYQLVQSTQEWLNEHIVQKPSLETEACQTSAPEGDQTDSFNLSVQHKTDTVQSVVKGLAGSMGKVGRTAAVTGQGRMKVESSVEATPPQLTVCPFFLKGKCKFGDKCHNLHQKPGSQPAVRKGEISLYDEMLARQMDSSGLPTPSTDSVIEDEAFTEDDGASTFSSLTESGEKKLSMKTATNVIHRIIWDSQLPSEHFVLGYLDRFVGIVEKPFKSFNWEDLSTVSHKVLAIPKHRIQYFKYKGVIVWDKEKQLDNVFGSRGTGKTIMDVMREVDGEAVGELEEEEEADNECELDPEDVEEMERLSKMGVLKQKADKSRPTHFIYIPVFQSKEIVSKAKEVQDHMVEIDSRFDDGRLPLENLHVSVGYVRLEKLEECQRATEVLKKLQPYFAAILPPSVVLHAEGVETFRGQLIYAKVRSYPALERFVVLLLRSLQSAGLSTPGNHTPFVPHITLLRLRRPMMRAMSRQTIESWMYQPFRTATFGEQAIQELRIGEMADIYIRYRFSISNSALCLSPALPSLVCQSAQYLHELGMVTSEALSEVNNVIHKYQTEEEEACSKAQRATENIRKQLKKVLEGKCKRLSPEETGKVLSSSLVVILRGLPGSGKSWLAHNCEETLQAPSSVALCSADSYFLDRKSGEYHFDVDALPKAHQSCLTEFIQALQSGKQLIIVDNTNAQLWEYQIYRYLAQLVGLKSCVLEIPCLDERMVELFASRNQHKVQTETALKRYMQWERDEVATILPPSVVNSYQQTFPGSFSLHSLCQGDQQLLTEVRENGYSVSVIYTGVYLDCDSQWSLVETIHPVHPVVSADHVTIVFHPTLSQVATLPLGKEVQVVPLGWATNNEVQALAVEVPGSIKVARKCPHITISTECGVSAKYSNDLLESSPALTRVPPGTLQLTGRVGMVVEIGQSVDKHLRQKTFHIFSKEDFQSILPFLVDHTPARDIEAVNATGFQLPAWRKDSVILPDDVGIVSGKQKITKLFLFDFDGTLFRTPDPVEGRAEYERLTGHSWPHPHGWMRWAESLLPPLRSQPGPALPHFHALLHQSGSLTALVTGRIPPTGNAVKEVLHHHLVYPEKYFFKDSPMEKESTPAYKVRIAQQLLKEYPDVSHVKVFDDLDDVLTAMHKLAHNYQEKVTFEVVDAKKMGSSATRKLQKHATLDTSGKEGAIAPLLHQCGLLSLPSYQEAAGAGVALIASQWAAVVHFSGPSDHLVLPFGSYCLGRRGDVDLCLLAPPHLSHFECLDLLSSQLQEAGTVFLHRGYASRCPRLKVMLQYSSVPDINFDIIFIVTTSEEFYYKTLPVVKPTCASIKSELSPGDSPNKAALMGPLFLQQVQNRIEGRIAVTEFAVAVEMAVWYLKSQRLKGNSYSCIRTFHVVHLLVDVACTVKDSEWEEPQSKADFLFGRFISKVASMEEDKWLQLFGDNVPLQYIPALQASLKQADSILSTDSEATPPTLQVDVFWNLLQRPAFPPLGFTPVTLRFGSLDKKLEWELATILEARMPTYIRQLISKGITIQPSGDDVESGCIAFAVKDDPLTIKTVQSTLKPLWNEIAVYRKHPEVDIGLFVGQTDAYHSSTSDANILEQVKSFAASCRKAGGVPLELHLPSSLTSYERWQVHEAAESLGLNHVSIGEGKDRHIVLQQCT